MSRVRIPMGPAAVTLTLLQARLTTITDCREA